MEQGSFAHLRTASGYVQSLAARSKAEAEYITSESPTIEAMKPHIEAELAELVEEDAARQTGDFSVYKYYFSSIGWFSSSIFFGFCIMFGVTSKVRKALFDPSHSTCDHV